MAICESLREAESFAAEVAAAHPELCCEIYDQEGKSKGPLRLLYNAAVRDRYEGPKYANRLIIWGSAVVACGIGFIVHDFVRDMAWIWGYVIGVKLTIAGGFLVGQGMIARKPASD